MLTDTSLYEVCSQTWLQARQRICLEMDQRGFTPSQGVPYLYGIFKAKKRRWRPISGACSDTSGETPQLGKPAHPLSEVHQLLTRIFQVVLSMLKEKDRERMVKENKRAYWIKESPQEIAAWLRQNLAALGGRSMKVVDFKDMYTNIPHRLLSERVKIAVDEALQWEAQKQLGRTLAAASFSRIDGKLCWTDESSNQENSSTATVSINELHELLSWTLQNCFVVNGATLRRQIKGIPMGISPSPQLANIFCYVVERQFMYATTSLPTRNLNCRYLDDVFVVDPMPSEDEYGMKYATSSEGLDVVYVGMRVYVKNGMTRTTLYDREEEYPFHILRYPHIGSIASDAQLGGVIMGRFVAAQQFCSTMWDFKQSIAWILRRVVERGFTWKMVEKVWSKFLYTKWQTKDIRTKELRAWFPRAWNWAYVQQQNPSSSRVQWKHPRDEPLEVQRDLFSAPPPAAIIGTMVNATNAIGVSSAASRGSERPNSCGCAADGAHTGGSFATAMVRRCGVEGEDEGDIDVEGRVVVVVGEEKELEAEVERKRNLWLASLKTIEVVPKSQFVFRKAVGDGNCLFYSLLQNNHRQLAQDLRNDMASWIGANPTYMFEGMAVELWISHQFLRGSTLTISSYSKSLRSTLQGGELEIQVFAEIYQTEVFVFQVVDLHSYRKTFCARASITPVEQASRVCILYTPGHFDWLEPLGHLGMVDVPCQTDGFVVQEIPPKERTVTVTIPTTTVVQRPVERVVETTKLVTVTETVPIPIEHVVQVPIERIVEKTVEKVIQQTVAVPVEIPVQVDRIVEVPVPVPVDRVVEVSVPVERLVSVPVPVERIVEREVPVEEVLCYEMQQRKRRLRRIEVDDAASCEGVERFSQHTSCSFSSQGVNNYSINDYSISLQCVVQEHRRHVVGRGPGGRPTSLFEKWTRFRGEAPFPEEDLPAVLREFTRAHSHAEGHWIRYNENIRSYLRRHVSGENLRERIQQWDRRHGLLLEGEPALLAIEAPRTTIASSSTTAAISSTSPLASAFVPSCVATRADEVSVFLKNLRAM